MIRIIFLWSIISTLSFSFGVDTIIVNQMNNNYNIKGQIPRFSAKEKEDDQLTTFLKEINDDIDYEFSEVKGQVISSALQFSDDFPDSNLLPFTLSTYYTFTGNSDASIYSVLIKTSYYTGGAHPNYTFKAYTLDDSRRYKLKDFFKDPKGAKRYMIDSIENSILINVHNSKLGLETLKYFEGAKVDLNQSTYYISGDNIILVFPHYTLGPYSSGEHEFIFSFEKLKPFLYKKWTDL